MTTIDGIDSDDRQESVRERLGRLPPLRYGQLTLPSRYLVSPLAGLWFVFSPDGKTLIAESGTKPKAVEMGSLNDPGKELFDVATGKSIATLDLEKSAPRFNFMAFSPDGKTLATGGKDGRILLWELPDARPKDK